MKVYLQKHAQLILDILSSRYLEEMFLSLQLHLIFSLKTIQYLQYFPRPLEV